MDQVLTDFTLMRNCGLSQTLACFSLYCHQVEILLLSGQCCKLKPINTLHQLSQMGSLEVY